MKILITGIAGFIGSHVAERLKFLGHEIIGIDNFNPYYDVEIKKQTANELANQNITVLNHDLRDSSVYNSLDTDFDYIFHFAAQPVFLQNVVLKIILLIMLLLQNIYPILHFKTAI